MKIDNHPGSYIEKMKAVNIKANWGTLYLGWLGIGTCSRLISFEDIFKFGSHRLENHNAEEERLILELLALTGTTEENDTELVRKRLYTLAAFTKYNEDIEQRKWAVVLLKDLLIDLTRKNCITCLTELTSFWAQFGYPEYSPHVVQGRLNSIEPESYYTDKFCNTILTKHRKWISDQLALIKEAAGYED